MSNYPAIDVFSGSGGLSIGLQNAGFSIKAAVEIHPDATKTYCNRFGDIVLNRDIRTVTGKELLKKAGIRKGSNFLLAGCPPCQGFSSIGPQNECDIRNELVFQYVRLIDETRPAFILMENVPGMSKRIGKTVFAQAVEDLRINYHVEYELLNAADYGVPQTRKRLVLHGIRNDVYNRLTRNRKVKFGLPPQTHSDPRKNDGSLPEWRTAEMMRGLPRIIAGELYPDEDGIFNHWSRSLSDDNLWRIRYIREHGGSRTCLPDEQTLACHKTNDESIRFTDTYGIMDCSKPAPTLTGGCTTFSKGRYGHPEEDRAISAREAARLQTFPDDHQFFGGIDSVSLQIGNAVPPLLAEASGRKIIELMKLR